jgi:pSer/pThr/pTyr-binding forkhead associated (FHA) protein
VPLAIHEDSVADDPKTECIVLRERKSAPPMTVTNARLVVPGRYLIESEEAQALALDVVVGSSVLVGRQTGSLFADDPFIDAHHAELTFRPDGIVVDDLDSINGVFVRVVGSMHLRSGDHIRIGEQLLCYVALKGAPKTGKAPGLGSPDPGYWARVDVLIDPTTIAASYPSDDVEIGFGQTTGHVQFPDDPFISNLHCRLAKDERGAMILDCDSAEGTWVRLRSGDVVPYGAELMVGQTLVRLDRT